MNYIILSMALFSVGVLGVLLRRNLIVILMSIELILSSVNIAFVAFSNMNQTFDGQSIVLLNFVIAAAEAAVGLAIIVSLFRTRGTINLDRWNELKG